MLNIGPLELLVLAVVGLLVLGPDRVPGLARDAARMFRTLRELTEGACGQLREHVLSELPELELPRVSAPTIRQALLGEDEGPTSTT